MADSEWPIIGLAGKARCGKDTAAEYLLAEYGLDPYSFAAPIKRALATMFRLSYAQLEGEQKEDVIGYLGRSPRYLMQTLGTQWGREFVADDVWVRQLAHEIESARSTTGDWGAPAVGAVITDVRFENEAAWIRDQGGVVVHLVRPDAPGVLDHESERGLAVMAGDVTIHNDGGLDDLYARLDWLIGKIHEVAADG